MSRTLVFLTGMFCLSSQAMAEPAPHLVVKSDKTLKDFPKGGQDFKPAANFKAKNGDPASIACKLLDDKKLTCHVKKGPEKHKVQVAAVKGKDTLVIKYDEKVKKVVGAKEIHLIIGGADGVKVGPNN